MWCACVCVCVLCMCVCVVCMCMYVWCGVCVWCVCVWCVCACVCVSLTTLEATLIYSTKNGHQWTANGILFILILQICSTAVALYHTSYGHTHLLKFKVHFKGQVQYRVHECWGYGEVITFSRLCALRVSASVPFIIASSA